MNAWGDEWVGYVGSRGKRDNHPARVLTLADAAAGDSSLLELHGGS